jgi:hypothetical protein
MLMVWKSHTKVAIGYHEQSATSSYVVFWYCPGKTPTTDFSKHRVTTPSVAPGEVGAACMKVGGAPNKYNSCFNEVQLKATNKLRYDHLSDAVSVDETLAGNLEKELQAITAAEFVDVTNCWTDCSGAGLATLTKCKAGRACAGKKLFTGKGVDTTCDATTKIAISVYKEADAA